MPSVREFTAVNESASVTQFAQQSDGFEPAEAFLNPLALLLAEVVTSVPSCAGIDGAPAGALGVLFKTASHEFLATIDSGSHRPA